MKRIFFNQENVNGDVIVCQEDVAKYLFTVLRMKKDQELILCDGFGYDYEAKIERIDSKEVVFRVVNQFPNTNEAPISIHLYQAFLKFDKMDLVLQKSVELGVCSVTFFDSEHCVKKMTQDKLFRYQKIAKSAAMQSRRGILPKVHFSKSFDEVIAYLKEKNACLCYENEEKQSLKNYLQKSKKKEINLMVGPEGGFSSREIQMATQANITIVSLGNRILRAETAPLFALSSILYEWEL